MFKTEAKTIALERACVLRQKQKQEEKQLQCTLAYLLNMESGGAGIFAHDIKELKVKLEVIDEERYRGAVLRARAERVWLGETPTKRALSEEKRYAMTKEVKEIVYQGQLTNDGEMIERAFVDYYSTLLSKRTSEISAFKSEYLPLMPKIDGELKDALERPISVAEIEKAIDDLSVRKSPGPDGLGAAIYKIFKVEMAEALHRVITKCYEQKWTPPSFRQTHVVLIPKSTDHIKLQSVEAYRPISLANIDYKVFMKVLAHRLQSVVKSLVGTHQTCGIKGRTIFTNIHIARSILECCDTMGDHVAMLQLDLAKAFDRVSHEILFTLLDYVNVGSVILDGVKMMYDGCTTNLIINNKLSRRIAVMSSIKQGCPTSALLFALYLEPFCLKLLHSHNIRGYTFLGREIKVLAYADDIAVFCRDKQSIAEAVREAQAFCNASGSAISWSKCLGLWHGNWPDAPEVFCKMQWSVLPGTYLGVPLSAYREPIEYWTSERDGMKEQTNKWGGHNFSMFARAKVCNIFLVAKVFYVLQVLCMSRSSIQKIHRVFAEFIWGSVWERTSRSNLFHTLRNGGLGLTHLFFKQLVSRFVFFRDQSDGFLRTVIQVRLRDALPDFVVSSHAIKPMALKGYLREVSMAIRLLNARFRKTTCLQSHENNCIRILLKCLYLHQCIVLCIT